MQANGAVRKVRRAICGRKGERLGAKVNFHLADRRSLAFNYVYGSVYEPDEARLRTGRVYSRGAEGRGPTEEEEGVASAIPRRAQGLFHNARHCTPPVTQPTGCLSVAH